MYKLQGFLIIFLSVCFLFACSFVRLFACCDVSKRAKLWVANAMGIEGEKQGVGVGCCSACHTIHPCLSQEVLSFCQNLVLVGFLRVKTNQESMKILFQESPAFMHRFISH